MTDDAASIPTAGSLSARIIRACKDHGNKCKLDCPRRQIEDLGEIASFSGTQTEGPDERSWRQKFITWMQQASHSKGGS